MPTTTFPGLPAPYDLRVRRGDTVRKTVTWRSGSGSVPPLVNLTGASAFLLAAGTAIGTLTLGGAAGTIGIVLSPADTEDMDAGGYKLRLVITLANEDVHSLLEGTLDIFE